MIKLSEMKKRSPVLDNMERQGFLKGRKEGIKKGRKEEKENILKALNELANDPTNNITAEELAKKLGYKTDKIINANKN